MTSHETSQHRLVRTPVRANTSRTWEVLVSETASESMSLEKILERLAHVVDRLEKGDLPLEQSLSLFEEGVRLTREGQHRLDAAEQRIEALLSTEPGHGEPATKVVSPGAGTSTAGPNA
jgi:exodeoxyribonuclease VII small subunit